MTLQLEFSESNQGKVLRHLRWLKDIGLIRGFAYGEKMAEGRQPVSGSNGTAVRNSLLAYVEGELARLPENWDGYAACPVEPEVIQKTTGLLRQLPSTLIGQLNEDAIFPNPNGTISIVWDRKEGDELFLEIGSGNSTYYFKQGGVIIKLNNHLHWQPDVLPKELLENLTLLFS